MAGKASSKAVLHENTEENSRQDLEQLVSEALLRIPAELDALLCHRYGLGSGVPKSLEEEAVEEGCEVDDVKNKEAQALRLLMGYGRRIS